MTYIDDWAGTDQKERDRLQESCVDCGHARYQHGDIQRGHNRVFKSHTPGKCAKCRCDIFRVIALDELLDVVEMLSGEPTLHELGIKPIEWCPESVWSALDSITGRFGRPCRLDVGHQGEHKPGVRR